MVEAECTAASGDFQGGGTLCDPFPCPVACCFDDGTCQDMTITECETAGGTAQAAGTSCCDV